MAVALKCSGLTHWFDGAGSRVAVLENIAFALHRGETCVLQGPSGSGKTTLLSILGCLMTPNYGTVEICGEEVPFRNYSALTRIRREQIGFVFQNSLLLPFLTARRNLELTGRNTGCSLRDIRERISKMASSLGFADALERRPAQLSGGQCQRVAVARALINRPSIVLADEPTAALDWTSGQLVVQLLIENVKQCGGCLLAVTHDLRVLPMFDRVLSLESGVLKEGSR